MSAYSDAIDELVPVGFWRLNEISGTVAADEQSANNGTYVGSPILDGVGLPANDNGTSAKFNGVDQAMYAAIPAGLRSQTFSIVFSAIPTTDGYLFSACPTGSHATAKGVHISVNASNYVYMWIGDDASSSWNIFTSAIEIDISIKQHFVLTYNSVSFILIINSVEHINATWGKSVDWIDSGTAPDPGQIYLASSRDNNAGTIAPNVSFNDSTIDEVAVFDKALTEEEYSNLYTIFLGLYSFDISIDHTKVPEDLYDFPLLVNLGATSGIDAFDSSGVFDELAPITADDDFTGVNGDPPDLLIWVFTNDIGVKSIENNTLKCTLLVSTAWESATVRGNYTVTGDFEITFDVTAFIHNSNNGTYGIIHLRYGGTQVYLGLAYNSGLKYHSNIDGIEVTAVSNNDYGSFKVTRSGSTFNVYYSIENDNNWVLLQSRSVNADDITLDLYTNSGITGHQPSVNFDNFKIVSGTIVWQSANTNLLTAVYKNPADKPLKEVFDPNYTLSQALIRMDGDNGSVVFTDESYTPSAVTRTGNVIVKHDVVDPWGELTGNAYYDGSGDYLSITTSTSLGVQDVTLEAWIYSTDTSGSGAIFGTTTLNSYNNRFIMKVNCSATTFSMTGIFQAGSGTGYFITVPGAYSNNEWHHVVLQRNSGAISIYVDGINVATGTFELNITTGIMRTGFVYSGSVNSYFKGYMRDASCHYIARYSGDFTPPIVSFGTPYNYSSPPADTSVVSQQCKVEIDRWDQVNQQAQLWLKVPYISKDVDTIINLSYDSTNVDNSDNIGETGTLPARLVWSELSSVYLLSNDGGDSAGGSPDGTLVNIDGTNIVDFGIGKGMTFNGTDEHIDLAVDDLTRVYTISMLIELTDIIGQKALVDGINGGWYVNVDKLSYNNTSDGVNALLPGTPYEIVLQDNDGVGLTYINGVLADSISPDAVNMIIDTIASETLTPANYFNGKLKGLRFSKDLKTAGWIASNYDSAQDTLVRYEHVDSFLLDKIISGTITETLAVTQWLIRSYDYATGALVASMVSPNGAFELSIPVGYWTPQSVTISPEQGIVWSPETAKDVGDLVFPNDPVTTPYYFQCTVSGTVGDGITGTTEPDFNSNTLPGNTVVDGNVTWEVVERMVQPITHSPLIPI